MATRSPQQAPRRSRSPQSWTPLIATLVLIGLFSAAVGMAQLVDLPALIPSLASSAQKGPDGTLRRSVPTKLSIPSIGVRSKIVEVERAADGSIAVPEDNPADDTGWYSLGPTPGERGTAVIVGHVDTAAKPAVFRKLSEVRQGKIIEVTRQDRRVATFTVDSVERFPKTSFPADRIFQPTDGPRLVLVTCGGTWVGGDVGYADNVIVFASLA